jgi:hypothetical protein
MSLRHKELSSITMEDLENLIANQVAERKDIEYKRELPGSSDEDKREFLADVSSFANTIGGDLIYGLEADDGMPTHLTGLTNENLDEVKLRLENLIRQCIQPRIHGIDIERIDLSNSNFALVIRIPQSWASPHMVRVKKSSRFYGRNSAGKYLLDISEIRAKFLFSETIGDQIRDFRIERLSKIIADETPVPLFKNPKIVLHLVPLLSISSSSIFDLHALQGKGLDFPPINTDDLRSYGIPSTYNLDGWYSHVKLDYKQAECYSYAQLFRNGCIEAVEAFILSPRNNHLILSHKDLGEEVMKAMTKYITFLKNIGLQPPFMVFLSLLDVRGYEMHLRLDQIPVLHTHPVDRDNLIIPEIILESFQFDVDIIMRPIFDAIWNACGYSHSFNYDLNTGRWRGETS